MANVLRSFQRAERKAASLPTAYRVNLALYALVVLGVGLIAADVKGESPAPVREVQTSPRRVTDTTRPPTVETEPPVVLGPGDLTPTPPPPVTPGGVVIGPPSPSPSSPSPPPTTDDDAPAATETVAAPPPDSTPVFTGIPQSGTPLVPTPANRRAAVADDPAPPPGTGLNLPDPVDPVNPVNPVNAVNPVNPVNPVKVTPVSIPPLNIPRPPPPLLP